MRIIAGDKRRRTAYNWNKTGRLVRNCRLQSAVDVESRFGRNAASFWLTALEWASGGFQWIDSKSAQ
ncbi:MAG: hypothetical protein LBG43_06020 [Treponema sp.]|nr:hypothetical protein [Treponema sp.]